MRAAAMRQPFCCALAVAAAGKNEESDYNDPDDVAIIKKVAKAVVHIYFLLEIMRAGFPSLGIILCRGVSKCDKICIDT